MDRIFSRGPIYYYYCFARREGKRYMYRENKWIVDRRNCSARNFNSIADSVLSIEKPSEDLALDETATHLFFIWTQFRRTRSFRSDFRGKWTRGPCFFFVLTKQNVEMDTRVVSAINDLSVHCEAHRYKNSHNGSF